MLSALVSTLLVAVVATLGDFAWSSLHLRHRVYYGIAHGAVLCLAMGLACGIPARRPLVGALGGVLAGVLGAASFYALAPMLGYSAMFVSWCLLWVLIACVDGPMVRRTGTIAALVRGLAAAVLSGIAFYLVSGMWTRWNPATINYLDHFARWAFAFLPGFLALRFGSAR